MTQPDDPKIRVRSNDLDWRVVEGEVVALDLLQSSYLGTNTSGALLWEHLVEGATSAQLASVLVETYGIDPERATEDVGRFLDVLRQHSLVEPAV